MTFESLRDAIGMRWPASRNTHGSLVEVPIPQTAGVWPGVYGRTRDANSLIGQLPPIVRLTCATSTRSLEGFGLQVNTSLELALLDLKRAFDSRTIRWCVFGAQAVSVWGKPRTTADVDITIGPEVPLSEVFESLAASGFEAALNVDGDFLRNTPVLPVVHTATGIPLDIVIGRSGFETTFLDRAVAVELAGVSVPVVAPDDLIVLKLIAGRPKDIEDATTIVAAQHGEMDLDRIRNLLRQIEEALDQSDLVCAFEEMLLKTTPPTIK